jgi:hypothetical protein
MKISTNIKATGKSMLRPPHIKESHWNEWVVGSAVDPSLTSLSVVSLEGLDIYDRLFISDSLLRRNDGRVSDTVYKKYFPLENGGWWCSGVDVLNNFESELWGQFKPDTPRTHQSSKGFRSSVSCRRTARQSETKRKEVKYEPPPKFPTSIYALPVPLHLWEKIAQRYGVEILPTDVRENQPDGGFWEWLIARPAIPVCITEGAKKAGAILTAGYVAIALSGIYNGYRQPKNDRGQKIGKPHLIPQLQVFAQKDRPIIFCFDRDPKPKTVRNVRRALEITGTLFERAGCSVSVISWNYPEKGVDDLIATRGFDCFDALYSTRIPFSCWKLTTLLDLSQYAPLYVNERYLSEKLIPPTDARIIGIKSAKATGKTEWLSKIVERATRTGQRILVLTHREQLAIALANRFGIDYRTEIKTSITKGVFGYALCIDSLHPHANPPFNPDEWHEAIIIIDEAEQVFQHLLDSSTCQSNRVAIIESFKQLLGTAIATGGRIFLADADLSPIAIDYVRALIGFPVSVWIVENQYNPNRGKRKLISYSGNDPRELVANLVRCIEAGSRPLIHTTGQKASSKWGAINLESYLKKIFPDKKILRIDRESVSEPGHPAMGCMGNLNALLALYDIAICSPVVETGVSIDLQAHFDSVWAIAQGVQTVDAVCQAIERLRDDVPRHLWAAPTAKNHRIGNGSISIKNLLASQHNLTRLNISLLQQAGIDEFDELEVNFSTESLNTWAKRACVVNAGKNNYRAEIESKLIASGYEMINPVTEVTDDPPVQELVNEGLKQARIENYRQYCQAVKEAKTPTNSELENLKTKRAKTATERLQERKGILSLRYGVEVTSELVEKDDKGWYPQLQLHYYLTVGKVYLAERERHSLSGISQQGMKAFKPDINKRQLSGAIETLEFIDIKQFLDPDKEFTANSLSNWFEMVIRFRHEIKAILGVSINPEKDSAVAVAQRILKKLGLKLEFKYWRGDRSSKQRVYSGCKVNPDGRSQVFANWLARERQNSENFPFSPFSQRYFLTKSAIAKTSFEIF